MRNLLILLFGLILFGLLGYACIYQDKANTIQADISERANTLLKDDISIAGDAIEAKVDGRDITLTGTVVSETMKQKAEEVAKVHGYRTFDNQLTVVESAPVKPKQPYHFSATKSQSKEVVLEGFVPSSDVQQELLTFAMEKFGEGKVTDNLAVTPGAPEGWLSTVQTSLTSLAALNFGKASLTDQTLEISGEISDEANSEDLLQKLKAEVSEGIMSNHQVSFDISVLAPVKPYRFTATKSESGDLILEGFVPSSDTQRQLVTQAQEKFGTDKVTDKLLVTPGASSGWLQTVQATLSSLAVLDSGKISLVDEKLEVSGEASSEKIIKQMKTDISDGIPSNHPVSFDLTLNTTFAPTLDPAIDTNSTAEEVPEESPKKPEKTKQEEENTACQKQFEQLLTENTILFRTSSAIISTKSLGLLKQLVEITQACSTQTISIEGHTDATGPSQLNQRLSQLRAESVVNYLVKKGIDKGRLLVQGHGENNPIADNATTQGRAANRRIEFIVKETE